MGKKIYNQEQLDLVKKLRLENPTYTINQLVEITGVNKAKIKRLFLNTPELHLSKIQSQNNAYKAKLAKNLNAMADMREKLTPEVVLKRSESIKNTYKNNQELSQNAKKRWDDLSQDDKDRRKILGQNISKHPNSVEYVKSLSQRTGDLNFKTQKILNSEGFNSSSDRMVQFAISNGGQFIGPYVDSITPVQWKCKNDHIFEMRPNNVQQGQWCPDCVIKISKGHQEIIDYIELILDRKLDEININNRTALGGKELDIYLPEYNLGIEYNGLRWHSGEFIEAGTHYSKLKACRDANISLFAIFSDEWESKKDLIKAMIRWRLKKFNGRTIRATDCELRKLTKNNQFNEFFERNHLDGHTRASYAYGLFFEDKLVSCLSIRTNFNKEKEIARLATDYDYLIQGGVSKLLAAVVLEKEKLVTFSNNRLSNGDTYVKLGFKLINESRPSYWYTDGITRVWRFKCKRNNDPHILAQYPTEQLQAENGVFSLKLFGDNRPLFKIEDYGHKKWILDLSVV